MRSIATADQIQENVLTEVTTSGKKRDLDSVKVYEQVYAAYEQQNGKVVSSL